ncbi:MAG: trypsin-like peptidase domain-containing protein [Candidatus Omnitrophota bacterium]|nr:trypsin-like peptidase domain-containing protein [Candidatus Omnitrophota bacterium]
MFRQNRILFFVLTLIIGLIVGLTVATKFEINPKVNALPQESALMPQASSVDFENIFINVAEKVGKAVVSISTETTQKAGGPRVRRYYFGSPFGNKDFEDDFFNRFFEDFFGNLPEREYKQMGLGTGVIIDKDGYILTNEHVIQDADKITVTLPDGREFKAEVKGTDSRSDLALVKIKADNLPVAILGDSDLVKIGQWVVAIGNPFGYMIHSPEPTVTAGVVSALHRSLPRTTRRDRDYTDLIQTDAAINPGNSGGPLVNLKGEIIGINVAIFTTSGGYQGVGFAIPGNVAKKVVNRLIQGKKVVYGWLGVSVQELNEKLAEYFGLKEKQGVLVSGAIKDGPAEKAGIKNGDIILTFDGQRVNSVRDVLKLTGNTEVGKKVKLGILRDKKPLSVEVEIGERPQNLDNLEESKPSLGEPEVKQSFRGIAVQELTQDMIRQFDLEEKQGVIITNIEPNSPADEAGLQIGDVITEINKQPIKTLPDYQLAIKKFKHEDCLLQTSRGYVVLKAK